MPTRLEYRSPLEDEVSGGRWVHENSIIFFRGQLLPSHFVFHVDEDDELEEGQVIGVSRWGQVLYWEQNSIIARG